MTTKLVLSNLLKNASGQLLDSDEGNKKAPVTIVGSIPTEACCSLPAEGIFSDLPLALGAEGYVVAAKFS